LVVVVVCVVLDEVKVIDVVRVVAVVEVWTLVDVVVTVISGWIPIVTGSSGSVVITIVVVYGKVDRLIVVMLTVVMGVVVVVLVVLVWVGIVNVEYM